MGRFKEVPVEALRGVCDPDSLGFETTEDILPMGDAVVAQERALSALKFGTEILGLDYNIFVAGPPRTGKTRLIKSFLDKIAATKTTPPDWCYVHNFKEPEEPKALWFPPSKGKEFKKDMEELIDTLKKQIPDIFDSDEYAKKKEDLYKQFNQERTEIIEELREKAGQEGFVLNTTQTGMVVVPAKDGKALTDEELKAISETEKEDLRKRGEQLHSEISEAIRKIRRMERNLAERERALDRQITLYAVGDLIQELREKYQGNPHIATHLYDVQEDVIQNIDDFKKKSPSEASPFPLPYPEPSFIRYKVNVFIDNSETKGVPVVIESNPTYPNLFGRIERKVQFGALSTDFTLLKPGSLHKANGGYLIMHAMDILKWFFSWDALKRAIKSKEIAIEDLIEQYGLISTKTLKPQPIPLEMKITLIGNPYLYHLLYVWDDQFNKIFKVKAHLDDCIDRNKEAVEKLTSYISSFCKTGNLKHMDKGGVARLIEYGSEIASNKEKLTLRLSEIEDVIKEANFWATERQRPYITAQDVDKAIEEKVYRSNLFEEKIQELVEKGIIKIETEGSIVGQINSLELYDLGDYIFGRPARVTASISMGKEGIIDIDRESKLSGSIHTKGVMILSGYLKGKYAHDKPLALSASLCFEQSYSMVEGDSASAAELFTLLSCLADAPISQSLAVTGSVSQKGEIQAIGGVTPKIEGFYAICKIKGLTGDQGVIIPEANVKDLMLKKEMVEAVNKGKFHIYPIQTVDEGMEILTGMKSEARREDGTYKEGTLNAKIDNHLRRLTEIAKGFLKEEKL